jgi:hypothetical protein
MNNTSNISEIICKQKNDDNQNFLFHELMWFYERYGYHFVCANLSSLFRAVDVKALLNCEPIRDIQDGPKLYVPSIVDVNMSRDITKLYLQLRRKIVSITASNCPVELLEDMEIVWPVMNETIIMYETLPHSCHLDSESVIVSYENYFTSGRDSRFKNYKSIKYSATK